VTSERAMVSRRFREQYEDALTCYLRDQELAGLDIVTDGDCRFDDDVGGQSWTAYPPNHMSGLDAQHPVATPAGRGGIWFPRGHILHDYLESRVMPVISGPVGRGNLQYTAMWKAAQRFTTRPVKFGAVSAEIDALPDKIKRSAYPIAGTYNCRAIADTGEPSPHGYGIAIDLNTAVSDYWYWRPHEGAIVYRNRMPEEIVAIFEKHGFIWGGKWYHFDTMHFEFRPELLAAK